MEHEHVEDESGDYLRVKSGTHQLYIEETDTGLEIHIRDHANISLSGPHKANPRLAVDSVEFPTQVEILDTEDALSKVLCRGRNIPF